MLTVLTGDAIEQLRTLPDESVQCCVTSPPYWGLRDYGTAAWEGGDEECDHLKPFDAVSHITSTLNRAKDPLKDQGNTGHKHEGYRETCGKCGAKRIDSQLGLEKTPEEYVAKMVEVFREVRRVLRHDGTLWLNIADTMLPDKNEADIPHKLKISLGQDGWIKRSTIIWHKPNPMPESVTDRPTKSHEYLFLLTKCASYFYDAEAIKENVGVESRMAASFRDGGVYTNNRSFDNAGGKEKATHGDGEASLNGRNKRSVWTIATQPYPEAHFATYPPDLIKPCIMAGTSAKGCCSKCGAPWERIVEREREATRPGNHSCTDETAPHMQSRGSGGNTELRYRYETTTQTLGWQPTYAHGCNCAVHAIMPCTVLDPFVGSGTTGMVALELGRKAVLIELNPSYVKLIEQRCDVTLGLQLA